MQEGRQIGEDAIDYLYEHFPRVLDQVLDLVDMCRRRGDALAEVGVKVGR